MSELLAAPVGALIYAGHDSTRAEILAAARGHLLAQGMHHLDVDDILADRPGLVMPAYWAGGNVGFCGAEHPDAVTVTAVNLPIPPEGRPSDGTLV